MYKGIMFQIWLPKKFKEATNLQKQEKYTVGDKYNEWENVSIMAFMKNFVKARFIQMCTKNGYLSCSSNIRFVLISLQYIAWH